jgi:hypothetical protein
MSSCPDGTRQRLSRPTRVGVALSPATRHLRFRSRCVLVECASSVRRDIKLGLVFTVTWCRHFNLFSRASVLHNHELIHSTQRGIANFKMSSCLQLQQRTSDVHQTYLDEVLQASILLSHHHCLCFLRLSRCEIGPNLESHQAHWHDDLRRTMMRKSGA